MHYEIAGKGLSCPHCGGDDFDQKWGELQDSGFTLFGLDLFQRKALIFQCSQCGRIEWFKPIANAEIVEVHDEPGDKTSKDESDPVECLTCGALVSPGHSTCEFCGWSYDR